MIARALKFVSFERVEDHFRQGWMASIPNAPMHHHHYGIELAWLCECPVPGGFKPYRVPNRIPITNQESDSERAASRG